MPESKGEDRLTRLEALVEKLADSVDKLARDQRRLPLAKKPEQIMSDTGVFRNLAGMKANETRFGRKIEGEEEGPYFPNDVVRMRAGTEKAKAISASLAKAGKGDTQLPAGVVLAFMRETKAGLKKYNVKFFDSQGNSLGEDGVTEDEIEPVGAAA